MRVQVLFGNPLARRGVRGIALQLGRHLVPDNLHEPPGEGHAALHGRPVPIGKVFHLQQLELREQARQRVVERVLQGLLGGSFHAVSGAERKGVR